jgi:hypothetical protein
VAKKCAEAAVSASRLHTRRRDHRARGPPCFDITCFEKAIPCRVCGAGAGVGADGGADDVPAASSSDSKSKVWPCNSTARALACHEGRHACAHVLRMRRARKLKKHCAEFHEQGPVEQGLSNTLALETSATHRRAERQQNISTRNINTSALATFFVCRSGLAELLQALHHRQRLRNQRRVRAHELQRAAPCRPPPWRR